MLYIRIEAKSDSEETTGELSLYRPTHLTVSEVLGSYDYQKCLGIPNYPVTLHVRMRTLHGAAVTCIRARGTRAYRVRVYEYGSLGSRPSPFVHICTIYKRMRCTHKNGEGLGLKYHVRIVGGAIGKALLLFPEARSPSNLVEELLASRIICTTYGLLSIWLLR